MRTAEDHLGKHVGSVMLSHIVEIARQRGYQRLSLETGSTDAFAAAIRLYERFGFVACEPFGDYKPDPFSCYFALILQSRNSNFAAFRLGLQVTRHY
jgi:putative acetyltransferase